MASEDSTLQGFKTFKPGSGLESSRPEECLAEGYAKLLIKLGANNPKPTTVSATTGDPQPFSCNFFLFMHGAQRQDLLVPIGCQLVS